MHALIMKSHEAVYLYFDDENVFYLYEKLMQEHKVREEQQEFWDHFSRVLEKVKEGKHKLLWEAALPESSDVPRALPIDT